MTDAVDNYFVVMLRGDHTLNEIKLEKFLLTKPWYRGGAKPVELDRMAAVGLNAGFLGPVASTLDPSRFFADLSASRLSDFVCGANKTDFHLQNVNWGRDCPEPEAADLRNIVEGDASPDGIGQIKFYRGIEGGHIFQLGRKYTEAMGLSVLDEASQPVTPWMGCYGIGVSRLVAAIIEQRHDDKGILWPTSVAPFNVVICPIGMDRSEAVRVKTDELYAALQGQGIDVLLDDRGQRPGAMFADAELIGIPYRIVIGDKALADGQFEFKARDAADAERITADVEAVLARMASSS